MTPILKDRLTNPGAPVDRGQMIGPGIPPKQEWGPDMPGPSFDTSDIKEQDLLIGELNRFFDNYGPSWGLYVKVKGWCGMLNHYELECTSSEAKATEVSVTHHRNLSANDAKEILAMDSKKGWKLLEDISNSLGVQQSVRDNGIKVEGMGEDAKVVTNDRGGKQSEAPHAFHLMDPKVISDFLSQSGTDFEQSVDWVVDKNLEAFLMCLDYMADYNEQSLMNALLKIGAEGRVPLETMSCIAKRLAYGAFKRGYPINNWRKIGREEHMNHAMNHLYALYLGDTQDDHWSAAVCRLHMALSTTESPNFRYQECVDVD